MVYENIIKVRSNKMGVLRVTIPKEVRELMQLTDGEYIKIIYNGDDKIILEKTIPLFKN